jgi:hypothetical protein
MEKIEDQLNLMNVENLDSGNKDSSMYQIFNKHNKSNLLNIIFDYIKTDEMLRISQLNRHTFNFVKNKYYKDLHALISTKYLSSSSVLTRNTLLYYKDLSEKILENERNVLIKILYQIIGKEIFTCLFPFKNFKLKDEDLNLYTFLSNVMENTQIPQKVNFPYTFNSEMIYEPEVVNQNSTDTWNYGRNHNDEVDQVISRIPSKTMERKDQYLFIMHSVINNKSFVNILKELNLSNNRINDDVIEYILPLLKSENKILQSLNLKNNLLGHTENSSSLLDLLITDNSIINFDISNNLFGSNAIYSIMNIYTSKNNKILDFNVSKNKFDVSTIISYMKYNSNLINNKKFTLSYLEYPFYIFDKNKLIITFPRLASNSSIQKNEFLAMKKKIMENVIKNKTKFIIYPSDLNPSGVNFLKYFLMNLTSNKNVSMEVVYMDNYDPENSFYSDVISILSQQKLSKITFNNMRFSKTYATAFQNFLCCNTSKKVKFKDCKIIEAYCPDLYLGFKTTKLPKIIFKNCAISNSCKLYLLAAKEENENIQLFSI